MDEETIMKKYNFVTEKIMEIILFCMKNSIDFEVTSINGIVVKARTEEDKRKVINFIESNWNWIVVFETNGGLRIIDTPSSWKCIRISPD